MTNLKSEPPRESPQPERRPYEPPKISLEIELEIRAGSPLGMPDPFDPLGLGLPKQ